MRVAGPVSAPRRAMPPARKVMPSVPKARPVFRGPLEQELPLDHPIHHESLAAQAAHGATFFTPEQRQAAAQMYRQNASPLTRLGNHVEHFLQLRQLGKQLVGSFDPRTRAGVANIAGLFAGGPEGDSFAGEMPPTSEEILQRWQPAGEFHAYGRLKGGEHVTGSPLDRGVPNEGPIRPGKGYNPSIQKMVEGAHTNPFMRASRGAADDQLNRLSQLENLRARAADHMALRRQLDEHFGSAPMQAHAPHPGDTSGAYLHGPSVLNHPNFLKALLGRSMHLDGYMPGNN